MYYLIKTLTSDIIVCFLKSVDTYEYHVRRCINREGAVRIDDDGIIANIMCILNNVLNCILTITPEVRFTTFQIERTPASFIKLIYCGTYLSITQVHRIRFYYLAV